MQLPWGMQSRARCRGEVLAEAGSAHQKLLSEALDVVCDRPFCKELQRLLLALLVQLQQLLRRLRRQLCPLLQQLPVQNRSFPHRRRVAQLCQGRHRALQARHGPALDGIHVGLRQSAQHCHGQDGIRGLPFLALGAAVALLPLPTSPRASPAPSHPTQHPGAPNTEAEKLL